MSKPLPKSLQIKPALIVEPTPQASVQSAMQDVAVEMLDLSIWLEENQQHKRFEKLKEILKDYWKTAQPNAPFFVEKDGKTFEMLFVAGKPRAKFTCAAVDCGNIGLVGEPIQTFTIREMGAPPPELPPLKPQTRKGKT